MAAAALLLPLVLAACFGGGGVDDGAESGSSSEPAVVANATTESGEGWTNYVPLEEPGDEAPSFRRERATCSLTEFRLLLDGERGVSAVLDEGGNVVASISTTTRDVADNRCRTTSYRPKRYQDDAEAEVAYDSGGVRCRVPQGIEIETFPILDGRDDVWGSNLVVSLPGRPLAIAGAIAVQDTNGRELHYLSRYCEPL